jgi:hypothetical protein
VAVVLGELVVAKVAQDLDATAVGLVHAVLNDATDVGAVVLLLLERAFAFVDQAVDELGIAVCKVEDAGRGGAVTASSSGFLQRRKHQPEPEVLKTPQPTHLVVSLETLRERVVDDIAHVRLVDSHTKPESEAG